MELNEKNIIEELNKAELLIRQTRKYINNENKDEILEILNAVVLNANTIIEQHLKKTVEIFKEKCSKLYGNLVVIENIEVIDNAMKITYLLDEKFQLRCILNINQSITNLIDMFSDEIDFEINKIEQDLDYLHEKLNGYADNYTRLIDNTRYVFKDR